MPSLLAYLGVLVGPEAVTSAWESTYKKYISRFDVLCSLDMASICNLVTYSTYVRLVFGHVGQLFPPTQQMKNYESIEVAKMCLSEQCCAY